VATSALPAVIDYLVATIGALPACAAPCVVSDGYLPELVAGPIVLVGVDEQTGETQSASIFNVLGAKSSDETFEIPCAIYSTYLGTSDSASPRNAAFAIYDAILTAIRADPTFGDSTYSGAGGAFSPQLGGFGFISAFKFVQTNTSEEASGGRIARIYFTVKCRNYFPSIP
jgi:hypothetical protein